jgi:hypothetical protein
MGYKLDGWDSIPGRGKRFLTSAQRPVRFWGPLKRPIQLITWALLPGLKRQRSKADCSPPSNAEAKKGGAIPPLPHISSWRDALLIKQRANFTFLCYI